MIRTAALRRAALRLVGKHPANVAPPASYLDSMDRCRVEYIMTRVAVLLANPSDEEADEFIKALSDTEYSRAQGAPSHSTKR